MDSLIKAPSYWYGSDEAKRDIGGILSFVEAEKKRVHLLGSSDEPFLIIDGDHDSEIHPDYELTIGQLKVDWTAVTTAAMLFGTIFLIKRADNKNAKGAYLYRHIKNRHPALRYKPESYPNMSENETADIANKLEAIVVELRSVYLT